MKILVCVKSVPDRQSRFRVNSTADGYDEAGLGFGVNEYDLYAMEAALRLRERSAGAELTAITVGPPRAEAALRRAMSLGADQGVWIDDSRSPAKSALAVAAWIAAWARRRRFDLTLSGVISEDLQRGQVGPMLAQLLGVPCATAVVSMELVGEGRFLRCERELEGGARQVVELPLPALLTVQSGPHPPRYPSLTNVLRVKQMVIPSVPAAELAPEQNSEVTLRVSEPEHSGRCEFLAGELDRQAEQLIQKVREWAPVW